MIINGIVQNIPSAMVVAKALPVNKSYKLEFVSTERRNDIYTVDVYLQGSDEGYKIRLLIISNILAYPALEMIWVYEKEQYELASRVYHRICDEVDDVKMEYDQSMMPVSTVSPKLKEAVKPISASHQEKTHILSIDEASRLIGASDWRLSLYQGRYPKMSDKEKHAIRLFDGNEADSELARKSYGTRQKY